MWERSTQRHSEAGTVISAPSAYEEWNNNGATSNRYKEFVWATNPVGNTYLGSVTTILNPGTSAAVATKRVQTVDSYGNLPQELIYDYGNLATPARTYNFTYLT